MAADHNQFANLIWQIADLLRGPYRPPHKALVCSESPSSTLPARLRSSTRCAQFKVPRMNTFTMLRSLGAKFDLRAKGAS